MVCGNRLNAYGKCCTRDAGHPGECQRLACNALLRNGKRCARPRGHASKHSSSVVNDARAYRKTLYARNRQQTLDQRRCAKYGIEPQDYTRMLARQGGGCAGCGRPPAPARALAVDHKHVRGDRRMTGKERRLYVRGLLCANCNRAIQLLRDSPRTLRNLAQYLENFERFGAAPDRDIA